MRSFTLTELGNKCGEVVEAAYSGPVDITRHGKRKFVIMTAETFDRMRTHDDPRRVFAAGEFPPDIADIFAEQFERLQRGEGYDE